MATERLPMRKTREILRQKWTLCRTNREVARSVGVSAGTVGKTVSRAKHAGLDWRQVEQLDEQQLEIRIYGLTGFEAACSRAAPARCSQTPVRSHPLQNSAAHFSASGAGMTDSSSSITRVFDERWDRCDPKRRNRLSVQRVTRYFQFSDAGGGPARMSWLETLYGDVVVSLERGVRGMKRRPYGKSRIDAFCRAFADIRRGEGQE
jgi:hypothetical protein